MSTATDPQAPRFASIEAQLAELRRSLDQLSRENAALRRWRTIALATSLAALSTPALLFIGKLSPRFKTVRAAGLETDTVRARYVDLREGEGTSSGSLFATKGAVLLTFATPGGSLTLHAGESGSSLSMHSREAKQSILLDTSTSTGAATLSLESGVTSARLSASAMYGESTELALRAPGGRVGLWGRKPTGSKELFLGALEIHRDEPRFMGSNAKLSIDQGGGRLEIDDNEGKAPCAVRLYADREFGTMLNLGHGPASSLLLSMFGSPSVQGVVGNETAWSMPAAKK